MASMCVRSVYSGLIINGNNKKQTSKFSSWQNIKKKTKEKIIEKQMKYYDVNSSSFFTSVT